ncbi:MAG: hypothetical protein RBS53_11400 [Bacteroidales bacterium]|jgi:antitoxin component YwqK of YwqJK toxin-antitoxin module|nr:hypothetical protein [Bacteroidales bacterium]NLM93466.1 hypothetical protein [Bacteroidales bacterium]
MDRKIKSLSVYQKNLVLKSSEDDAVEGEEYLITRSTYEPVKGRLLEETQYSQDRQAEQITRNGYDDQGFLTSEELLDGAGNELEKRSFEPDDQGRIAREFIHYADGTADRIEYVYDEKGRVVKKEHFDDEGEHENTEVFTYEGDMVVREAMTDAEGELLSETVYTYREDGQLEELLVNKPEEETWFRKVYRYDETGAREAVTTFNRDEEPVERVLFEYDDHGRPIQVVEENRKQKNTLHMEYNEQGDIVFQEEYDVNGELVNRIERNYSADGLLLESRVLLRDFQRGVSRNYVVRNEYSFFES